jgi:hypothetical protein
MQGHSKPDKELLDAAALCDHLLGNGTVVAFVAERHFPGKPAGTVTEFVNDVEFRAVQVRDGRRTFTRECACVGVAVAVKRSGWRCGPGRWPWTR